MVNYNEEDEEGEDYSYKKNRRSKEDDSDDDTNDYAAPKTDHMIPSLTPHNLPDNAITIASELTPRMCGMIRLTKAIEATAWPELQKLQPEQRYPVPLAEEEAFEHGLNGRPPLYAKELPAIDSKEPADPSTTETLDTDLIIDDADFEDITPEYMNKP